jgi:hypothetical protein
MDVSQMVKNAKAAAIVVVQKILMSFRYSKGNHTTVVVGRKTGSLVTILDRLIRKSKSK